MIVLILAIALVLTKQEPHVWLETLRLIKESSRKGHSKSETNWHYQSVHFSANFEFKRIFSEIQINFNTFLLGVCLPVFHLFIDHTKYVFKKNPVGLKLTSFVCSVELFHSAGNTN